MALNRWIAIVTALAVLVLPALSLADHHKAGGVAADHRSDRAAEKSNAQWDEDNEGKREKHHGKHDHEDSDDDAKDMKDMKGMKDEKGEKERKDKKHRDIEE
jgi:hypothetical protein